MEILNSLPHFTRFYITKSGVLYETIVFRRYTQVKKIVTTGHRIKDLWNESDYSSVMWIKIRR